MNTKNLYQRGRCFLPEVGRSKSWERLQVERGRVRSSSSSCFWYIDTVYSSYSSICFMLSCGPSCWSIAHASCSHGRCSCRPGYIPQVNTISTKTTLIIHHDNYHLFHHIMIIMSCCSTPPSPHPDYPVVQLEQPTRLFSHLMEGASKSTDIIQVKRKSQNNNFSNIFL